MNDKFYSLAHDTWGYDEKEAIHRVMCSGRYTMGKETEEFEEQFAKKMGSRNAVMVNSGSSANLVAMAAWKYRNNIPDGSEIIVPAVSWSTTYYPITQLNMVPVFVDIDQYTLNISPSAIADAITDKTRAIFVVNLLGNPADFDVIRVAINGRNISILEDNCESLGAKYRNRYTGTFGEFGTFSFFFSHHIQTMEGGMIITDDDILADYMRSMRAHGWVRGLRTGELYKSKGDSFEDSFKFILPGYCVRPLEMSAAVGKVQLNRLDDFIQKRRVNASLLKTQFGGQYFNIGKTYTQYETDYSSWFGFAIILDERIDRAGLMDYLYWREIETRPIVTGNFTRQPVMQHLKAVVHPTPHADIIHDRGFFVGNDDRDLTNQIATLRIEIYHYHMQKHLGIVI